MRVGETRRTHYGIVAAAAAVAEEEAEAPQLVDTGTPCTAGCAGRESVGDADYGDASPRGGAPPGARPARCCPRSLRPCTDPACPDVVDFQGCSSDPESLSAFSLPLVLSLSPFTPFTLLFHSFLIRSRGFCRIRSFRPFISH